MDASAAGGAIECPTCGAEISVPEADITNIHALNPIAASAAAKIERHFSVPVREGPSEVLLRMPQRPPPGEAVAAATAVAAGEAPAGGKRICIKIFRHSDCIEVGRDRYEEMVAAFLNQVGEANIISINALTYTHVDIGSQKILTDYAVQILYRS